MYFAQILFISDSRRFMFHELVSNDVFVLPSKRTKRFVLWTMINIYFACHK